MTWNTIYIISLKFSSYLFVLILRVIRAPTVSNVVMYMYAYNHNSEIFVHDRAGFTFSALLNSREGSRLQKNRHYCFIINTTTEKK